MSCSKACVLPQYVILSVMGFLGVVVSLAARGCLSMAITEMIVPIRKMDIQNEFSICPAEEASSNGNTTSSNMAYENSARYNWTEKQQGWILSSFSAGYLLSHIPAGVLSERFGGKMTLSLAVFLTAALNAVTPQVLDYGGYYGLIILRISMGLAGGITFPAVNVLLAAWIPETKRGSLGSFVLAGSSVGYFISFYLSGVILSSRPWPMAFYFWSIVCLIWVILFMFLCYKDPASHPFISKKELNYLKNELKHLERDSLSTPWKSIFTSSPVIALILVQMSHDCVAAIVTTYLPKYTKEVLGFPIDRVGLYISISFLSMWICSIISGLLSDHLVNRNYLTIVRARKFYAVIGGIIPTATFVVASYAGCNRLLFLILLMVAMGFVGCYFPGPRINSLDVATNFAGSIMSVANGCGALTSWIFLNFIGIMTQSDLHDSKIWLWRNVYWTLLGTTIAGVGIYLIWASGDVQPWNNTKESQSHECDKLTDNVNHDDHDRAVLEQV